MNQKIVRVTLQIEVLIGTRRTFYFRWNFLVQNTENKVLLLYEQQTIFSVYLLVTSSQKCVKRNFYLQFVKKKKQKRHRRRLAVLPATARRWRRSSRAAPVCCIRITRGCSFPICITTTITRDWRVRRRRTERPWTRTRRIGPRRSVLPARPPAVCDRCRARRSCRCTPRTEDAAAGNWNFNYRLLARARRLISPSRNWLNRPFDSLI